MAEQVSLFAPDIWSGKTSREPLALTREKISQQSSKKRSVSSARKPPLCLCLKRDGLSPDASTMSWADGVLLGEYTMPSFGESPREENASLLSQILEDSPHPKYFLSEKACLGILTRAERRGKELPPELKAALLVQSRSWNEEENLGGGKGILIQEERTGALSTLNNQSVLCLQGNMIDRDAKMNGIGISKEPMYSLNTVDRHGVLCAGFDYRQGSKAGNIGYQEEQGPTLTGQKQMAVYDARGNGDGAIACTITGDHQNRVTDYTALAVDVRNLNETEECSGTLQSKNNGGYSLNYQNPIRIKQNGNRPKFGGPCHPLAAGVHAPSNSTKGTFQCTGQGWWNAGPVAQTIRTACGGDSTKANLVAEPEQSNYVRRLTPLECERLQGYPDGWTDIGEWVDSKGKKHKESSDTARYKALGNSIALPFWFWLLRRISAQYERPATLGSLFDGIGGFPLCWERCNGKGTALWASEIEEFPMAVTKMRLPGT